MGIVDWFKGAAKSVSDGVGWLGRNVVAPTSDFLKKIPIVGDVVRAADPLGNFIQKAADHSSDFYGGVEKSKRRAAPTLSEGFDAVKSGIKTGGALFGGPAGKAAAMVAQKLGF